MSSSADLLGESDAQNEMSRIFGDQIRVMVEIRDWGLALMRRALAKNQDLADLVVVGAMHRQVVATLDATIVGLTVATPTSALVGLRALTEAVWGLRWALADDTVWRAHSFLTQDLRHRRLGHLRRISGTPENKAFLDAVRASHAPFTIPSGQVYQSVQELPKVEKMLARRPYKECNEAFDRVRGKQRREPPWYSVGRDSVGPLTIRALSEALGSGASYVTIYSMLSRVTHAHSLSAHLSFQTDGVLIEPIRNLGDARFVISLAPYLAIQAYQDVIDRYRPGELESFARHHLECWKPVLDATPVVEITPNPIPLGDPWPP